MTACKANRCCCIRVGSLLALWLAMSVPVAAQTAPSVGPDIVATMDRLAIKLPAEIAGSEPVRRPLEELTRERCDQKAIATLGTELDKRNFRKKVLSFDLLVPLKETQMAGRHRPAQLFRFDTDKYGKLKKRGFNFEL